MCFIPKRVDFVMPRYLVPSYFTLCEPKKQYQLDNVINFEPFKRNIDVEKRRGYLLQVVVPKINDIFCCRPIPSTAWSTMRIDSSECWRYTMTCGQYCHSQDYPSPLALHHQHHHHHRLAHSSSCLAAGYLYRFGC
jgi:hypothetical protein